MRYPSFIEKGNTIGFVAPSFGCAGEPYYSAFQNSLKKWNALGFKTELGFNCYASDGVGISSSPKKCAAEFMEYYKKETNQALISCGGGELMCEILELLQGKKFEMQNYPMWEKESLKDEEHPLAAYHVTEPFVLHTNKKEGESFKIEGRLLGGCLDCLSHLRGTKFDKVKEFNQKYEDDGILWFLESCDLNVFEMRRTLWSLKQAGWFDTCRGFLIGRPGVQGQIIAGLDQYEAVLSILSEFDVPIFMDLDIGHVAPMIPLICGSYGKVTVVGNDCCIAMSLQ